MLNKKRSFLIFFFIILSLEVKASFNSDAFTKAKSYLTQNSKNFANQNYLVTIDYSKPSHEKRFHLYDLKNKKHLTYLVAHGKGSDPQHTGKAIHFGDVEASKMTSLGFFKTLDTYIGQHGYSLKLEGLSESNKNAFKRLIVIHGASYVDPSRKILGRSWGCPALENRFTQEIIDKIKGGALIYAFK